MYDSYNTTRPATTYNNYIELYYQRPITRHDDVDVVVSHDGGFGVSGGGVVVVPSAACSAPGQQSHEGPVEGATGRRKSGRRPRGGVLASVRYTRRVAGGPVRDVQASPDHAQLPTKHRKRVSGSI